MIVWLLLQPKKPATLAAQAPQDILGKFMVRLGEVWRVFETMSFVAVSFV